ncbi:MAG: type II toxin-antitoxin system VapC family toxin [Gemmatimonadetes bacterium]|jgi:uncharacterized protein|nr:type II toxin-antitoxin system VapC family toxin [Gemmatimonadota bacterium]
MIFYYLDASAWVKRYYQESGTAWMQALFSQPLKLVCSSLGLIEVVATLARKRKAGEIGSSFFAQKIEELEGDWRRFIHVQLTLEAVDIAKEVARDHALRGADAIHLGSALMLRGRFQEEEDQLLFVTSDQELKGAAQSVGLSVSDPQEEETVSSQPSEGEGEEDRGEE